MAGEVRQKWLKTGGFLWETPLCRGVSHNIQANSGKHGKNKTAMAGVGVEITIYRGALDLKSLGCKAVPVRFRSQAPILASKIDYAFVTSFV